MKKVIIRDNGREFTRTTRRMMNPSNQSTIQIRNSRVNSPCPRIRRRTRRSSPRWDSNIHPLSTQPIPISRSIPQPKRSIILIIIRRGHTRAPIRSPDRARPPIAHISTEGGFIGISRIVEKTFCGFGAVVAKSFGLKEVFEFSFSPPIPIWHVAGIDRVVI